MGIYLVERIALSFWPLGAVGPVGGEGKPGMERAGTLVLELVEEAWGGEMRGRRSETEQ